MAPDVGRLKHKLHPRTGFMIFFPGAILLGMLVLLLFSPRLQAGGGGEGLAATFAIDAAVVCSLLWSDFGHDLSWDNESVHLRQYGGRFLMRRHRFQTIKFNEIRRLKFHPAPRGVPAKFPLLELDVASDRGHAPLFIDPNFFTGATLASFIKNLCARRPEVRQDKHAVAIDRLLAKLGA